MTVTYPNRAAQMRARLMAQPTPPPEPVVIEGATFWLRSPVLTDRDTIQKMAMGSLKVDKDGNVKTADVPFDRMLAAACVTLVVDEVGQRVFEDTDIEVIRAAAIGSWIEQLAMLAIKKLNPGAKDIPEGEALGGLPVPASGTSSQTA